MLCVSMAYSVLSDVSALYEKSGNLKNKDKSFLDRRT